MASVVVGGAAPRPRSSRCRRAGRGSRPAGTREITTPTWVGSVVVCSVTAGTEAGLLQRGDRRLPRLPDRRLGTVIAPVEAKIVTCEPRATCLPAAGLWLSTLPCGSVESRCTSVAGEPGVAERGERRLVIEADHVRDRHGVGPARDQQGHGLRRSRAACRRAASVPIASPLRHASSRTAAARSP